MDVMKAVRVWCKQHIWFSIKHITRHPLRKIKVKYRLACWPTSSYTYFVFDESGIRGSFVTMWPQVYISQKISFHSFLKPIFALFEIPYPGYKGRHGRVFFIFVEVDKNFCIWYNQASFIISFCLETDVSQKLPYFLSKFLPCAALCVKADVSALCKPGFRLCVPLCSKAKYLQTISINIIPNCFDLNRVRLQFFCQDVFDPFFVPFSQLRDGLSGHIGNSNAWWFKSGPVRIPHIRCQKKNSDFHNRLP